jgi:4-hydroxybenzoyl-CoA thioesterase/acyl-CoA thioester hydrolase
MSSDFVVTRRIEFADTDMAGMAHFSAYFRLMEEAEHEFLRSRGLSVLLSDDQGPISFPRASATCDYRAALRFEDTVDISVRVTRVGEKSVTYRFELTRDGKPVAEGAITTVCCRVSSEGPPIAIPIPAWIAQKLRDQATA